MWQSFKIRWPMSGIGQQVRMQRGRTGWRSKVLAAMFASVVALPILLSPSAWGQSEDLNELYQRYEQLHEAGNYSEALVLAERMVGLAEKRFGKNHISTAATLNNVALVYRELGRYDDAEKLFSQALKIHEKALGSDHPDVAQILRNLALVYGEQGNYRDAERLFARALAINEKSFGPEHTEVALVLNNLGVVHRKQGRHGDAEKLLARALTIREKALGREHPGVAATLHDLANVYSDQHRIGEAEKLYARALAINEKAFGPEHPDVAIALDALANVHWVQGRLADAEKLYTRALSIKETALGPEHPDLADSLIGIALVRRTQTRYGEAEKLYARVLAITEKRFGAERPQVALVLNNLSVVHREQGRYSEAEKSIKRALAIREKALGAEHPDVGATLDNLAIVLAIQGHYDEAQRLAERALAISQRAFGSDHPNSTRTLNTLARLHKAQGRYGDAERFLRHELTIVETAFGPENPDTAITLTDLGEILGEQRRYADAEKLFARALALREKALGLEHPGVAQILNSLAHVYQAQSRYEEAEKLYARALAFFEKALGSDHLEVEDSLRNLGQLAEVRNRWAEAHAFLMRAGATQMKRHSSGPPYQALREGRMEERHVYRDLASASWQLAREQPARKIELRGESFVAAQRAIRSATEAALFQTASRFAAGGGELGTLVREAQDLANRRIQADKRLIEAISAPAAQRNETAIIGRRAEIKRIEERLGVIGAHLDKDFPAYAELSRPKPLNLSEVQAEIGSDEAFITYLTAPDHVLVWAVTRQGVSWQRIETGEGALGEKITTLRQGLDCQAVGEPRRESGCSPWQLPFNIDLAHELFEMLLGPIADVVIDKRHLIVVLSGTLTSLPFHLLVTEKPAMAVPEHYANYRDPAWLIKRHALTVVPSVSSHKALRVLAKAGRADTAYVGFGDPVFSAPVDPGASRQRPQRVAGTRAFAAYFRGRLADRDALISLAPLPETAIELRAIARTLGVPESEIYLRKRATETVVKGMNLERYQIVHFATHGLVAGDLQGLAEPALALSVPAEPSELDDGLLTASEAAQLKLNADWVILSACNTAAGDKPGAEALSGLARAFFYAGARALLVSHWPVESDAAVKLTTRTLSELKANPGIGRAEALRRGMLALMADRDIRYAHPALWGPFMVVGEGGPGAGRRP